MRINPIQNYHYTKYKVPATRPNLNAPVSFYADSKKSISSSFIKKIFTLSKVSKNSYGEERRKKDIWKYYNKEAQDLLKESNQQSFPCELEKNETVGEAPVYKKYYFDRKRQLESIIMITVDSYKNSRLIAMKFDKEKLTSFKYKENDYEKKIDTSTPKFLDYFLCDWHYKDLESILLHNIVPIHVITDFYQKYIELANDILYGKKSKELEQSIENFEQEFEGITLKTDNNVAPKIVENLSNVLRKQPYKDFPKQILLTNFLLPKSGGVYVRSEKILVRPFEDMKHFERVINHEIEHRKIRLTNLSYGISKPDNAIVRRGKIIEDEQGQILKDKIKLKDDDIIFIDKNLEKLIKNKISYYAASEAEEFLAEVASLMRDGTIGVKSENGELVYLINSSYLNANGKEKTITKKKFKKLMQTYGLLGGIPEINDNFKPNKSGVIVLTSQEIFKPDRN